MLKWGCEDKDRIHWLTSGKLLPTW